MTERDLAKIGKWICYVGIITFIGMWLFHFAGVSSLSNISKGLSTLCSVPVAVLLLLLNKPKSWFTWVYMWGLMVLLYAFTCIYGAFWGFPKFIIQEEDESDNIQKTED